MTIFKHILVPIDFEESSLHALRLATDVALALGAQLSIVHVWDIPPLAYAGAIDSSFDFLSTVHKAASEQLKESLAKARERMPNLNASLRRGVPWQEILSAIDEKQPDLVVMGTHGRRGLRHVLLGSVAEKVVRLSPVPVLTVREPA